jgi:glycerol uptake facilitator-like aquaporin
MITSVMPPMPMNLNWWATWLYNVAQLTGANAGSLVSHSPVGQQLEAKLGVSQTKTMTATTTTEVVASPKE